jgi:hypothetical protein
MRGIDDLASAARGLLVLPTPGTRTVTLTGRVLRYDPDLDVHLRRELVAAALASADDHSDDPVCPGDTRDVARR